MQISNASNAIFLIAKYAMYQAVFIAKIHIISITHKLVYHVDTHA